MLKFFSLYRKIIFSLFTKKRSDSSVIFDDSPCIEAASRISGNKRWLYREKGGNSRCSQTIKMLLLFLLLCSFQAFIQPVDVILSNELKRSRKILSTKSIAVRIVGGEVTDIRKYPFLVGEMRP